jgi:[protein-PII] uridylyltransferase
LVITRAAGLDQNAKTLNQFLEGFPRRYLRTRAPEEIALHHRMAEDLRVAPIQTDLHNRRHSWELTVLTHDRPYLFASLAGVLTAWGMNIIAADAFANRLGVVLDTFRFVDLFRTLELNPSEQDRMRQTIAEVLSGGKSLEKLMQGRVRSKASVPQKLRVPTQLRFDDEPSMHSTLLELVAEDRPGLLYQVSSLLSDHGCNIEVALIETQGQRAIDVFYLTSGGRKLDEARKQAIAEALHKTL